MDNDSRCFKDFELPRLLRLAPNLYAASFHLMKLLPARYMLDQAERDGHLKPGGTICETTSGTFGLALAMLAAVRGYRLILVSDPAIDDKLKIRLQELGATVDIVAQPNSVGGYQQARLDRLAKAIRENPGSFCPSQYTNEDNRRAYGAVSEWIANRLGNIDCLVGTVGSGGSMSGTAHFFRHLNPGLNVIGVDTHNSVIFGQQDGKRPLRGLGNSLMPENVDHRQFDEVHWVDAPSAFLATRKLHQRHGLFQGGTSGAAWLVADWWAKQNPGKTAIAFFPDEGHRYVETIYNDEWLGKVPGWTGSLAEHPVKVQCPQESISNWSYFEWRRRSYAEVMPTVAERKVA